MVTTPKAGDVLEIKHTGENIWHPAEVASIAADGQSMQVSLRPGRSILCEGGAFSGLITLRKDETGDKWLNSSTEDEFLLKSFGHA